LVSDQAAPLDAAALSRMILLHDTHDLWPKFIEEAFGPDAEQLGRLRFNQTTLNLGAAFRVSGCA
tara:strand:- start:503 stop:697 length:195 start_codon:yes stop_codon:yes gene_type:complete